MAYLFISHDLGVVKYMCENLAIMHNSRFVEYGSRTDIYTNPTHIYTKRLIAAIPDIDPTKRDENAQMRNKIAEEYEAKRSTYYKEGGKVFDLKQIGDTHHVALP